MIRERVSFIVVVTLKPNCTKEENNKFFELEKLEDHFREQIEMIPNKSARDSEFHIESITMKKLRGGKRK